MANLYVCIMNRYSVILSRAKESHSKSLRDCFWRNALAMTISFAFYLLPIANCFSQGTWTQKANFGGIAREVAVGFSIGNKGYIGTGVFSPNIYRDFWEWNQRSEEHTS